MKRLVIMCLLTILLVSCGNGESEGEKYNSDYSVYTLDLYLDDTTDTLTVEGELSYLNTYISKDELYLHVYPNALNIVEQGVNNIEFEYVRIEGEEVAYDIEGDDNTTMHIELDEKLLVEERLSIEFKYTFHYWDIDRILAAEGYYLTMFFYPFVAVYDADGWNVEPFSFRGESYFNELGDYYVSINTPDVYEVAASGNLVQESEHDKRITREYEIQKARDFSFSASSMYQVHERTIDGRLYEIYAIETYKTEDIDAYFEYMRVAFDVMETGVGPYPYDHFTLELGYFYGMESTGVIYCSHEVQEATIVHEIIHQWFYSIIHNDQADEPFLDEALTTYVTAFYFDALFGKDGYNGYLDYRSSLKEELSDRFTEYQGETILRHLSEYGEGFGYLVYYHGPTIYRYYTEEYLDGDITRFMDVLEEYYNQYAYEIVTIEEFFTLLEAETGETGTKSWLYQEASNLQDFSAE